VPADPESAAPLDPEPPLELEPPSELALPLDADPLAEADCPELAPELGPELIPDDPLEDPAPDGPFVGPELEPIVDALEEPEEVPELVPVPSLGDPEAVPAEFAPQAKATAMSTAAMAFGLRVLVMSSFIPGCSSEGRFGFADAVVPASSIRHFVFRDWGRRSRAVANLPCYWKDSRVGVSLRRLGRGTSVRMHAWKADFGR
jgi:hypothetical protein